MEFSDGMKDISYLGAYIGKLTVDAAVVKWPVAFAMGIVNYFLPSENLVEAGIGALCLIIFDTLTGICAAWQTGKAISSAKFGRVLVKLLGYGSVLAVSAIVSRNLPGLEEFKAAGAATVLTLAIATESISVLENVRLMGIKIPSFLEDALKERESRRKI
jgi:toxin secretion/phage lysis holin